MFPAAEMLLAFLFLSTCANPFSTREPEPPSNAQAAWIQPVSPEIVFDNFEAAIREKNVENYLRCFGASESVRAGFRFVPELSIANNYQDLFVDWNITRERNYINNLFTLLPSDSVSSLILTPVTESQFGDSVRAAKDYDLFIAHTKTSVNRQLIGRMDVTLRKGADALWYISYWADFKTGEFHVWSKLKAEF
ncbi:hypothetical protein ACFL6I_00020 [candidate division KSB1 bacterium]